MAELEQRVTDLEKKVSELELNINKSLNEIKIQLTEIATSLKSNTNSGDLKNELIEKDVRNNSKRLDVLENNQSKIIWTIVLAVIGLIGEAVIYYLQNKP